MGSAPILSGELSFYVILYDFFSEKETTQPQSVS